jgi:Holliday junction DNA helicase RuvA
MIGRIKGELLEKQPPHLMVDVQGVGYELDAPMSTFYRLPAVGQMVMLHTHFVVREDAQQLFAFFDRQERSLFRTLIKVNGVGPKLGLAILSGIETDDFVRCVNNNDIAALVRVPGVGKKTAERLIIEMKDKFKDWMPANQPFALEGGSQALSTAQSFDSRQEAESALIALGYKPAQASKSVGQASKAGEDQSAEELIRAALKSMI